MSWCCESVGSIWRCCCRRFPSTHTELLPVAQRAPFLVGRVWVVGCLLEWGGGGMPQAWTLTCPHRLCVMGGVDPQSHPARYTWCVHPPSRVMFAFPLWCAYIQPFAFNSLWCVYIPWFRRLVWLGKDEWCCPIIPHVHCTWPGFSLTLCLS